MARLKGGERPQGVETRKGFRLAGVEVRFGRQRTPAQAPEPLHPSVEGQASAQMAAVREKALETSRAIKAHESAVTAVTAAEATLHQLEDVRDEAHRTLLASEPYKFWANARDAVRKQESAVLGLRIKEHETGAAAQAARAQFAPAEQPANSQE